jgi:hypothetical protein
VSAGEAELGRGAQRSIGEVIAGVGPAKVRRTFQPVRRNSYHVGEREGRVWRPVDRRERWARIRSAELYDLEHKEWGKRSGPLGHVALEVLRAMYRVVDFKTGRLDPSINWMMRTIRRSRAAIVAALARLRKHGFLEWIRRTEPTGNEGAGPQVRQITNAYGFMLPAKARAFVARMVRRAPVPDDELQRRADDAAATETMVAALELDEQARHFAGDGPLGDALARLGLAVGRSASSPGGQNPDQEDQE